MSLSDVQGLFDREDDVFNLRHAVVLQDFGVRHGDVDARHPGGRRIQVVEGGTWKHTDNRLVHCNCQITVDLSNFYDEKFNSSIFILEMHQTLLHHI